MPSTTDVNKARGERAMIEQLVAAEEARVRRAFRRFLQDVRSVAVRRQVRLALESGGVEAALRVVDAHIARLAGVTLDVFRSAGAAEAASLARQVGAVVAVSFDPSYPRAADAARRLRLDFVREITRTQREVVRAALVEALAAGAGPIQTGRAFASAVGLTEYQRQAVATYRALLEAGDAAALQRGLRDRRFDSSVRRAAEEGVPLGRRRIARMVDRYRDRYLQYRGETIARTETLRALNTARTEAVRQMLEQADLPPSAVTRTWRSTQDSRVRDAHAAMNGQERDAETPFQSPSGARLMHPGDGSLGAPASELVNCRCVLLTKISAP